MTSPAASAAATRFDRDAALRTTIIATTAFLTLVDLFAMQAVLPALARRYDVAPAAIGVAVNASTVGMAIASAAITIWSRSIDRRRGVVASLALLALPTALLAGAPDLATFTALRIAQGLCMASAFSLMLAYLGEHFDAADSASVFAAYIAGNVASNFIGRLLSAAVADHFGLAAAFYAFAGLNLLGAALASLTIAHAPPMSPATVPARSPLDALRAHLAAPRLRASFAIGFLILFAFIGVFTYVNFVLAAPPLALDAMQIGFVYFVFAPSILTTLLVGRIASRVGARAALLSSLLLAIVGLPLLLASRLELVLAGLTLVAVGTFAGQATVTGFVGRAAIHDRGAASGLYLACYFAGGLAGSAALGQLFQHFGWGACVAGVAAALAAACALSASLGADGNAPLPRT